MSETDFYLLHNAKDARSRLSVAVDCPFVCLKFEF